MQITNFSNVEYSYTLPDGSTQTENKDSNVVTHCPVVQAT